jgi:hypothetical protein
VNISEKGDVVYQAGIPDQRDMKPHAKVSKYDDLYAGRLTL